MFVLFFRKLLKAGKFICYFLLVPSGICFSQSNNSLTDNRLTYTINASYHCLIGIRQNGSVGNTLSIVYNTLPANQAGANQNSLWLWRATEVPWEYPPMKRQLLPINATESGSYTFDSCALAIETGYIVCYSVDTSALQICACAHLASNNDSSGSVWVGIDLVRVYSDSLVFSYNTLPGYLPATYRNWVGLWNGQSSPYNSFPPLGSKKVDNDANMGNGLISNIRLKSGQTYTLVYFTGEKLYNAAAMITFTIKPYPASVR